MMSGSDFSGDRMGAIMRVRRQIRSQIERIKARPATCFSTWGLVLYAGVPLPFDDGKCPVCESPECELAIALLKQQERFRGGGSRGGRFRRIGTISARAPRPSDYAGLGLVEDVGWAF
jgi:hypothetical protein